MFWVRDEEESISCAVTGRGPIVLLLHSLGGGMWVWDALTEELSRDHTVLSFDAPGHGRSQYSQPFSVDRSAAIAARLLRQLGAKPWNRASIVGVSMGGHTALRLKALAPDLVGRLVLANHSLGATDAQRTYEAMERRVVTLGMPAFAEAYVLSRMQAQPDPAIVDAYARSIRNMPAGAFLDAFRSILAQSHHALAKTLEQPVLVVGSTADVSSPLRAVRELAETIPNARLGVIEGGNHFAYLDAPDQFNAFVLEFLRHGEGATFGAGA